MQIYCDPLFFLHFGWVIKDNPLNLCPDLILVMSAPNLYYLIIDFQFFQYI